jgi:hypothetical protein
LAFDELTTDSGVPKGLRPNRESMLFYNMEGEQISEDEAARLFRDIDYRRVAEDSIGDAHVSTVLLMLDHDFMNDRPVIFETMIFGGKFDGWQWRYCTREEAVEGHREAVELVSGARFWRRLVRIFTRPAG